MSLNGDNWNYFLMLEKEVEATFDFVEPSKKNYSTFSISYAKLILSICGEFDSLLKDYCKDLSSKNKRPSNIQECFDVLKRYNSLNVINTTIKLTRYKSIQLKPFDQWSSSSGYKKLSWWGCYNSIKHNRLTQFELANLENCLNALAALFIINVVNSRLQNQHALFPTNNTIFAADNLFARILPGGYGSKLVIDEIELKEMKGMSLARVMIKN